MEPNTIKKWVIFVSSAVSGASSIYGFLKIISKDISSGVIICFALGVIFGVVAYYTYLLNRPPWIKLKSRKIIEVSDASGKIVKVTLIKKIKVNYKGVVFMPFVNLLGAGGNDNFMDFCLDGDAVSRKDIEKGSFGVSVRSHYKEQAQKNQVFCSSLSYIAKNCFLDQKKEDSGMRIEIPTKKIVFEIHLPKDKPAKKAYILEFIGSDGGEIKKRYDNVDCYNNGTFLEWEKENPKVGRYFKFVWEW